MKLSEEIAAAAAHASTPTDTRKRYARWANEAQVLETQIDLLERAPFRVLPEFAEPGRGSDP